MEHKICEGCQWNNYPECYGTKMETGLYMNIGNLSKGFGCGQKDELKITDFSIIIKSDLELRVESLEEKTKDLEMEVR